MKMKFKRKMLFFIALISLFYCVTMMQDTYAKYLTSAEANAELTIARWSILVNDQDIVNNSNFSEVVVPTFNGTTNINSNVIAPTSTGYFDLLINANDTDVSFTYTVSIDTSDCNVSDLVITGYTIGKTHYDYDGNDISNDILLTDTDKTVSIRFDVEWNDGTGENMNNAQDTEASKEGTAAFDINVNFIQKR
jgi:hypothetical protein